MVQWRTSSKRKEHCLGYGEIEALEALTVEAIRWIDKHLIQIMYN
jgi:hypothetical protein